MSAEDVRIVREALRPNQYTGPLEQIRIDACLAAYKLGRALAATEEGAEA